MLDREVTPSYNFDISNSAIHEFATAMLLGEQESEIILTQGRYFYKVKGGESGHLYYKKGEADSWVLIANWCFYGLYIVVRYRKPVWLRPIYRSLFAKMNFVSVAFHDYAIEIVGTDGEILRGRRLRLTPPSAFTRVMTERFNFSEPEVESLKLELGL